MVPAFAASTDTATLLAVASRSQDKAQEVATRHGIARAYGSYDALLADPEIEAVYLPLPNDQHCPWTLRALEAGKHVLVDKPGALTYMDALRMAETAQQGSRRLMEGFMYRFHPQHARVAALFAAGEIGTVAHFTGAFTYFAPSNSGGIRWNPAQGGGAFWDTGVYPLNAVRLLFGAEPVAVSAVSQGDPETGVDLRTIALLEWADGRTATLLCGFDQAFTSRYELRGSAGTITAERAFQVGENGVTLTVRDQTGEIVRTEPFPHCDAYTLQIVHFSRCVRDTHLSLWPGENGEAQARVGEALVRAAREHRRVELAEVPPE